MRLKMLAVTLIFAASVARADIFGCGHKADRRVTAPLTGVSHITVIGRAGTLKVSGRAGAREVVATGTACASDKDFLNDIQLRVQQNGSNLRIEAVIPESGSFFGWMDAKLDFEVTVPDSMPIEVTDGSGEAWIENVGPLKVEDGSGDLTIRGVHGNADVTDGSGSLTVKDVAGNLEIVDGSGGIEINRVGGSVTISDGSGGIEASDVKGDFTIMSDGSGSVDVERIGGRVTIPHRHR